MGVTSLPERSIERGKKPLGLHALEGVFAQVIANAALKRVGADPRLDRGKNSGALFVRDSVERFASVGRRDDGLPNGARAHESIDIHDPVRRRERIDARPKEGCHLSTMRDVIHVAIPSLSQRSFHHDAVTRFPNHWCASSCAMMRAWPRFAWSEALAGSTSSFSSRNVMSPAFSIAPDWKSGTATMSSLSYG